MTIEIGRDWTLVQGNEEGEGDLTELAGEDEDVAEAERLLRGLGASAGWTEIGARGRAAHTAMRAVKPMRARFVDLPFPLTAVPAAVGPVLGTADAIARPQKTFRPQRLYIDPVTGLSVGLIIIGSNVQFVAVTGAVPASLFQNTALGANRHFDTAQISNDVLVRLLNSTGAPITAAVAFSGPMVE